MSSRVGTGRSAAIFSAALPPTPVAQGLSAGTVVRNPPATLETWGPSPGWEGPLEKEMATHSSTLVCGIPWTEQPGGLWSTGSQSVLCPRPCSEPFRGTSCRFILTKLNELDATMMIVSIGHLWTLRSGKGPALSTQRAGTFLHSLGWQRRGSSQFSGRADPRRPGHCLSGPPSLGLCCKFKQAEPDGQSLLNRVLSDA